ncbi:DUF3108 domain-containing protein [Plebeiibacterium marinum]|uniref:DUF3108 domain-containing protein n=1 Tax=Plebeiibacterium marinum TaxID=2992111 RepID=A0AAE3ME35_9BACT|nr:DUF3108 domain-containing protein [Plebeiobacterium marinum]MCW3806113.1 DUF3108 domain-containing protein [Plebeiobacterium marinum]
MAIKYFLLAGMFVLTTNISLFSQGTPARNKEAYQAGEYLKYSLRYSFITGGYVSFSVQDSLWNSTPTNYVQLKAKTSGLVDAIFKLRDRYASFIDKETNQPVKSIRDIKEGSYRYYNEVTYNYAEVLEDSIRINSQKSGQVNVPRHIQDILSAFYYARKFDFNDDMKKGEILEYTTYFSDEIFPLRIKYVRNEVINTSYGNMECFLFYPVTEVGRAFKTEEDMQIWITRDNNRIPVKVKVNLKVGSFICDLVEFKGLKNSFSCIRH